MRRWKRLAIRDAWAKSAKARNRKNKVKERARRDARMIETVRGGELPFTPDVMSWLSAKLGKQSTKIAQDDLRCLL